MKPSAENVDDVVGRDSRIAANNVGRAILERDDDRAASREEQEKSRSSGSTTKTADASKSGSVSFETASLTDEKRTNSISEGSAEDNRNSDSVSPETPSRSSVEKVGNGFASVLLSQKRLLSQEEQR